jgi:ABC-type antimicrobial peptide transport system permease subunit
LRREGPGAGFYFATGVVMTSGGFFSDFSVSGSPLLRGFGIAVTVGVLSAMFPALRATRTSIAEALRYVG